MVSEFRKKLEQLDLKTTMIQNIEEITKVARNEFPCLSCPSNDECNTFKWFLKWFGEDPQPNESKKNRI